MAGACSLSQGKAVDTCRDCQGLPRGAAVKDKGPYRGKTLVEPFRLLSLRDVHGAAEDNILTYSWVPVKIVGDAFTAHCCRHSTSPASVGEPRSRGNAVWSLPSCTMARGRAGAARRLEDGRYTTRRDLYPVRGVATGRLNWRPPGCTDVQPILAAGVRDSGPQSPPQTRGIAPSMPDGQLII